MLFRHIMVKPFLKTCFTYYVWQQRVYRTQENMTGLSAPRLGSPPFWTTKHTRKGKGLSFHSSPVMCQDSAYTISLKGRTVILFIPRPLRYLCQSRMHIKHCINHLLMLVTEITCMKRGTLWHAGNPRQAKPMVTYEDMFYIYVI